MRVQQFVWGPRCGQAKLALVCFVDPRILHAAFVVISDAQSMLQDHTPSADPEATAELAAAQARNLVRRIVAGDRDAERELWIAIGEGCA